MLNINITHLCLIFMIYIFSRNIYLDVSSQEKEQQEKQQKSSTHNNGKLYPLYGRYKIFRTSTQRNEVKKRS